jgi:hypothetical protein
MGPSNATRIVALDGPIFALLTLYVSWVDCKNAIIKEKKCTEAKNNSQWGFYQRFVLLYHD